jgi:hypothetical protein
MKLCPKCRASFDQDETFCDLDGVRLIAVGSLSDPSEVAAQPSTPLWVTGVIGGFIGVVICVLLYLLFLGPQSMKDQQEKDRANAQSEQTANRANQVAIAPAPIPVEAAAAEVSPNPEESPSPSPSPTAAAPVPPAPKVNLNSGPIATGDKRAFEGEHAIIKMKDGSSVEADAAWEDAQGVWFRRSGLVSFVDKNKVVAIEPSQKRPAATETKVP